MSNINKFDTATGRSSRVKRLGRAALLGGVSTMVVGVMAPAALAQDDADQDVIVVTGIRGSLQQSMDIKRDSQGVVDAISAEDIGKFPDTNLAESLQRITGVSIDRQNGEGSKITVRGFGPNNNLITFNGRTLPTADVQIVAQRTSDAGGGDRSFDFANLASEGVSALEVYKTGNALVQSGGLGATVNIQTRTPLDTGTEATVQVKALHDTSVGDRGRDVTPEVSGLFSWRNDTNTIGFGAFGSYSERDSGAPATYVNDWVIPAGYENGFENNAGGFVGTENPDITNAPPVGELFAVNQDSRYTFSDIERTRLNGQLVAQFRPQETLTITGDYTFAETEQQELRQEQSLWFNNIRDEYIFESGPVYIPVYQYQDLQNPKDIGFEQTNRAQKDDLSSLGLNVEWEATPTLTVTFDAHTSEANSSPDNPLGHSATAVAVGAIAVAEHSVDFSSGYPTARWTLDDSAGNGNGILDIEDVGSQQGRWWTRDLNMEMDEVDLRADWEIGPGTATFGANRRDGAYTAELSSYQQTLGDWGVANPGELETLTPGAVDFFCLACEFDDIPAGDADRVLRADAAVLFPALFNAYAFQPPEQKTLNQSFNEVEETITAVFANYAFETEVMELPTRINVGLRYEETEVSSAGQQTIPTAISWTQNNDFTILRGTEEQAFAQDFEYDNLLPNIDIAVDITPDLVGRVSYSTTIGRPAYGSLYSSFNVNAPGNPTPIGAPATGSLSSPDLVPLESDNIDLSLEYYYDDASYVSVGFFDKQIENFIGTGTFTQTAFGLTDPSSGAPGTRSGLALEALQDNGWNVSEDNLFTLTALIDENDGDVDAALATFAPLVTDGEVDNAFAVDYAAEPGIDVNSEPEDPLYEFAISRSINQEEANINGWEFAWQHFFGDTGFGFNANYTIVDGDVEGDPGQIPRENEFALVGLSDSANISALYENYGLSARLSYNWRDTFLYATNQGGDTSPRFTDEYSQLDMNVSYDVTDQVSVSFEAINLTGEDVAQYERVRNAIVYGFENKPRYTIGARYSW